MRTTADMGSGSTKRQVWRLVGRYLEPNLESRPEEGPSGRLHKRPLGDVGSVLLTIELWGT